MHLVLTAFLFSLLSAWCRRVAGADVEGPVQESGPKRGVLTVRCRYEPGWEHYVKYWCRGAVWKSCAYVVKTAGDEREKWNDRVSIQDDHRSRTFTITVEDLREGDAGSYWCAVEKSFTDLGCLVQVTVGPEITTVPIVTTTVPIVTTTVPTVTTTVTAEPNVSTQGEPSWAGELSLTSVTVMTPGFWSLFFKLPSLFLILLKVPLLLSLLCTLVWANRH